VITGVPQLFVQRKASEEPPAVVAKVTDDILIVGTPDALVLFIREIRASLDVGRFQYHTNMTFNGAFISVAPQGFTLNITEPLASLRPITIEPARQCCQLQPIATEELTAVRSLAGPLNYIGQAACPPATFFASTIQQLVGRNAQVSIIVKANAMIKELQRLPAVLHFPLTDFRGTYRIVAISDASFAPSSRYFQTGLLVWFQPVAD
jgi:hypothetical protein